MVKSITDTDYHFMVSNGLVPNADYVVTRYNQDLKVRGHTHVDLEQYAHDASYGPDLQLYRHPINNFSFFYGYELFVLAGWFAMAISLFIINN